jgi:pyrophosphatase PpaX
LLNINAILFDLDGTLVDTKELIVTSFTRASIEVLGEPIPAEKLLPLIGIPIIRQVEILAPGFEQELIETYRAINDELHDELIAYYDGTREMLEELQAQGKRLGVVTSKRKQPALEALQSFDLQDYFEFIVGMEETQKHKPEPEPLLLGAKLLGATREPCVYIGDSPYDMQAGRAANMYTIAANWGMFTPEELVRAGAQYEANSPREISKIIQSITL